MGRGDSGDGAVRNREFGTKLKKVCGYAPITWAPVCLDMVMPAPVSDGKRIFVYNGRRAVHAFDLHGQALWNVWQDDAVYVSHYPEDLACSPVIIEGLLLMYAFDHLWAYELDTGKLRYRTKSPFVSRHGMGQGMRLDLPAGGGKTEPALYLWTGDLVRVRDGKILCASVTGITHPGSLSGDGVDRVFLGVHPKGAGGPEQPRTWQLPVTEDGGIGLRFTLRGDEATVEAWLQQHELMTFSEPKTVTQFP